MIKEYRKNESGEFIAVEVIETEKVVSLDFLTTECQNVENEYETFLELNKEIFSKEAELSEKLTKLKMFLVENGVEFEECEESEELENIEPIENEPTTTQPHNLF